MILAAASMEITRLRVVQFCLHKALIRPETSANRTYLRNRSPAPLGTNPVRPENVTYVSSNVPFAVPTRQNPEIQRFGTPAFLVQQVEQRGCSPPVPAAFRVGSLTGALLRRYGEQAAVCRIASMRPVVGIDSPRWGKSQPSTPALAYSEKVFGGHFGRHLSIPRPFSEPRRVVWSNSGSLYDSLDAKLCQVWFDLAASRGARPCGGFSSGECGAVISRARAMQLLCG